MYLSAEQKSSLLSPLSICKGNIPPKLTHFIFSLTNKVGKYRLQNYMFNRCVCINVAYLWLAKWLHMQLIQSNINVFINWECAEGSCFYENITLLISPKQIYQLRTALASQHSNVTFTQSLGFTFHPHCLGNQMDALLISIFNQHF